mmetsp:Transcript_37037/g.66545  ORF Transcript_37037/g.66545 Transcript_37037/m.66545 type:complete len:242 (-) Transcript_37037:164-889(-)
MICKFGILLQVDLARRLSWIAHEEVISKFMKAAVPRLQIICHYNVQDIETLRVRLLMYGQIVFWILTAGNREEFQCTLLDVLIICHRRPIHIEDRRNMRLICFSSVSRNDVSENMTHFPQEVDEPCTDCWNIKITQYPLSVSYRVYMEGVLIKGLHSSLDNHRVSSELLIKLFIFVFIEGMIEQPRHDFCRRSRAWGWWCTQFEDKFQDGRQSGEDCSNDPGRWDENTNRRQNATYSLDYT